LYGTSDHPTDADRRIENLNGNTVDIRGERERTDYELNNWELGGDYEYSFANGSRAMLLFIVNDETDNNVRERFELDAPLQSDDERKSLYVESNNRTRERIAQTTYNWSLSDMQDMQLGVERAQTILDS